MGGEIAKKWLLISTALRLNLLNEFHKNFSKSTGICAESHVEARTKMDHWVRVLLHDGLNGERADHVNAGLERAAQIVEASEPYRFRTQALEEVADALSECTELPDLSKLMWTAATEAGFENFIIFMLKNGANKVLQSRVCTSCNSDWVERYQSQAYQFIDPVMAAASLRDGIFEFADLDDSAPAIADFWADADAHRIGRNGLCIAQTRPDGARIGVSFLTTKPEAEARALVRLNGSDLLTVANLAVDAFCFASYGLSGDVEMLSTSELRFLYLLATGKDPQEAFEVLPEDGTNKSLQASIRRKLGVDTVFQAVSQAAARGYFDEVPYEASEVTQPFPNVVALERSG